MRKYDKQSKEYILLKVILVFCILLLITVIIVVIYNGYKTSERIQKEWNNGFHKIDNGQWELDKIFAKTEDKTTYVIIGGKYPMPMYKKYSHEYYVYKCSKCGKEFETSSLLERKD